MAFTSSLGQFPLGSDALNAVMLTDSRDLSASLLPRSRALAATGTTLTAAEAQAMMQRAADAAHSVSYSGRQSFLAYRNGAPSLRRSMWTRAQARAVRSW